MKANAIVKVVATDALNVVMKDGKTPVSGDHVKDEIPPSEVRPNNLIYY